MRATIRCATGRETAVTAAAGRTKVVGMGANAVVHRVQLHKVKEPTDEEGNQRPTKKQRLSCRALSAEAVGALTLPLPLPLPLRLPLPLPLTLPLPYLDP